MTSTQAVALPKTLVYAAFYILLSKREYGTLLIISYLHEIKLR